MSRDVILATAEWVIIIALTFGLAVEYQALTLAHKREAELQAICNQR
jgi:hypothetical protein